MSETTLSHGDLSTAPTQDLYRHVNGGWLDSFEIPDDRAGDGAMRALFDTAEQKVRELITGLTDGEPGSEAQKVADLYASFMDTDRVEAQGLSPLVPELERITAVTDHTELIRVLAGIEARGAGGSFGAYVDADAKNSEVYALYLVQGGLHLPDEAYYREDVHAGTRKQFVAHIAKFSQVAGLSAYTGRSDEDLATGILELETRLAKHHWDRVRSRDAEATYNKMSFAELVELGPGFDFAAWCAGAGLTETEYLVVNQPSFFTGLGEVWSNTPLADLKAWAIYDLVRAFSAMLNEDLVEENFDFYSRKLSGTPSMRERWKRGVGLVESLLGEAVGKLYVATEFPPESKDAMLGLVENLIRAYEGSIRGLDWMSEETKAKALTKLGQFTPKIGYPEVWREYPAEMRADDLVGNVQRAAMAEHARQLGRIGAPIDRTEWLMTPQTVNAYYHPVMNEIVFPAAILQAPFFDVSASDATNYGAIGAVIGHEIGHGFDDQGSRYDGEGNLVDWWTEEDRKRFEERTASLISQFDALVPAGIDPEHHVNGALTIGENIGDLGGLSIAWKALHIAAADAGRPVSADDAREFFFSWARAWRSKFRSEERIRRLSIDPHSPEEFRCNQIVKNMDAFVETFGASAGDAMFLAPEERVTIW